MAKTQDDVELLMGHLLEPVREMLKESGGFLPFAAYLDKAKKVRKFIGEGKSEPDELTAFFEEKLRGFAEAKKAVATAIVSDVRAVPPGKRKERDCVAFALDHAEAYSVVVFLPYELDEEGNAVFGELFAIDGENRIFG